MAKVTPAGRQSKVRIAIDLEKKQYHLMYKDIKTNKPVLIKLDFSSEEFMQNWGW